MDGQQINQNAAQLAALLEKKDIMGASNALQKDSLGMHSSDLLSLISRTNIATSKSGADQLSLTTNGNGFPVVEFFNQQKSVDASVAVNVTPDAPVAAAALPQPKKDCTMTDIAGAAVGGLILGPLGALGAAAAAEDNCNGN